MKRVKNV